MSVSEHEPETFTVTADDCHAADLYAPTYAEVVALALAAGLGLAPYRHLRNPRVRSDFGRANGIGDPASSMASSRARLRICSQHALASIAPAVEPHRSG